MCTIYDVNNRDPSGAAKIVRELAGYEGFLSSCRFLDDSHILTGSGDMKMCVFARIRRENCVKLYNIISQLHMGLGGWQEDDRIRCARRRRGNAIAGARYENLRYRFGGPKM